MNFTLHADFADQPKAYRLQRRAWKELKSKGWAHYIPDEEDLEDCEFILALDSRNRAAGILIFQEMSTGSVAVELWYVLPKWRGKGVFKRLYKRFEQVAKRRKYKKVETYIEFTNSRSLEAARNMGMTVGGYYMEKKL